MRKRDFHGRPVSVVALGTSEFGGKCPEGLARDFMDAYVALGGDFIDTARVYGDFAHRVNGESERVIGRWLDGRRRDDLFLSTKGAHPDLDAMNVPRLSRDEILDDARRSLENLRTDHVDIYWLHRDDAARPVGDIVETLNALLDAGMTRRVGVSNWTAARVREANAWAAAHGLHGVDANQPQLSLARQVVVDDPTLVALDADAARMHRETGLPLVAFSSQGRGFFSKLDALGESGLPEGLRRQFLCDENREIYRRVLAVRAETGLSVGTIAVAWVTGQPFPAFALCGASRIEHVLALKEAGDAALTDAQRDYLRRID